MPGSTVHRSAPHSTVVQHPGDAPAAHFDVSTPIPGYVLVEPLGRGAYGQVWQGVRVGSGQDVAVKIFTAPGRLDWRYLQREVDRLLRVAEHPHIVTLLDANLQHDPPYYAMALLRQGSLADHCAGGRMLTDNARAGVWFEQMAAALEFAHSKSLLHCDLKPANVLLDEEGHLRLVDFGQAQIQGEAAVALGTLAYMAPEQAVVSDERTAPPDPSVAWDVYGLGATMYALLTGQAPYAAGGLQLTLSHIDSVGDRLIEYRRHVMDTPLTPIRQINPAINADFAAIVEHCLQPDPGRRYGHVGEVKSELRHWRSHRPLACQSRSPWYVVRKFVRRNLGMVSITLAALVALGTLFMTMRARFEIEREQLRSEIKRLETMEVMLRSQMGLKAGPADPAGPVPEPQLDPAADPSIGQAEPPGTRPHQPRGQQDQP